MKKHVNILTKEISAVATDYTKDSSIVLLVMTVVPLHFSSTGCKTAPLRDLSNTLYFTAGISWLKWEKKASPRNKRGAFCYYHENPHTFGQVINHRWSLTVCSSFSGCLTWNPGGWFAKCWVLEAVIEVSGSCALNIYRAIKSLNTLKHQAGAPKSVGPLTLISLWLSSPSVKWEYCHLLVSQGCCEFESTCLY